MDSSRQNVTDRETQGADSALHRGLGRSWGRRVAALVGVCSAMLGTPAAHAGGVQWSIGVQVPVSVPGVVVYPQPPRVAYAPAPVYVQPAPQVVYVQPPPPPSYPRHRHWHHRHHHEDWYDGPPQGERRGW